MGFLSSMRDKLAGFVRPDAVRPDAMQPDAIMTDAPVEKPPEREYRYPGHDGCMINCLDERNPLVLEWIENTASSVAYIRRACDVLHGREAPADIRSSPAEQVCRIHRLLFGQVYDWAGEYRECEIEIRGHSHIGMQDVESYMEDLEAGVAPSAGKSRAAAGLCRFCQELNNIHPFVNGNGRTQMLACVELAKAAGYDLFVFPDDIAEFDKARGAMYAGQPDVLSLWLEDRLFARDDPSELHMALLRGAEAELVRADKISMDLVLSPKAECEMLGDADYLRRRATGRAKPSVFSAIMKEHDDVELGF